MVDLPTSTIHRPLPNIKKKSPFMTTCTPPTVEMIPRAVLRTEGEKISILGIHSIVSGKWVKSVIDDVPASAASTAESFVCKRSGRANSC